MLYKGPDPKSGITLNGKDILDYAPSDIVDWIMALPPAERDIITAIITTKMIPDNLPADYAKEYGRPDLKDKPYMTCENDGYAYLGHGHAPNCNGKKAYKSTIYVKGGPDMCWCEWATKRGSQRKPTKFF